MALVSIIRAGHMLEVHIAGCLAVARVHSGHLAEMHSLEHSEAVYSVGHTVQKVKLGDRDLVGKDCGCIEAEHHLDWIVAAISSYLLDGVGGRSQMVLIGSLSLKVLLFFFCFT